MTENINFTKTNNAVLTLTNNNSVSFASDGKAGLMKRSRWRRTLNAQLVKS